MEQFKLTNKQRELIEGDTGDKPPEELSKDQAQQVWNDWFINADITCTDSTELLRHLYYYAFHEDTHVA